MSKSGQSSLFPAGHKEGSSEDVLVKDCKVGNGKRVIKTKGETITRRAPQNQGFQVIILGRQVGQLPRLGRRAKKRLDVNPHAILENFTVFFFLLLSSFSVRLKGRVHN